MSRQEPIAIVGAACRFPGADGLDAFWHLLASGAEAVSQVGDDRWSTRFFYHPNRDQQGKSYTWSAGLIGGVDRFEPAFFGISPREAQEVDPQQRILLELAWHAIEDAGIPAATLGGGSAGVFIGASATDYADLRLGDPPGAGAYFMAGNALSILANRISHVFDLRGPSLAIDTACSSSLVALHQACEAIRKGEIPIAIVGGINLLLSPYPFLGFCRAGMLSRRGHCYAFDARADGYVRGEGGGALILKPLAAALADGDRIRALILASGVNSDGRTIGLSLPSEQGQTALLRETYDRAGIAPDDLLFFEMHGTGTPAGDPVEAAAVGRALGQRRRERLPIGSAKTNIGHLEPASGMAGILKAVLAFEHGIIPPSLHCQHPNPKIPFDELNLRLIRTPEPIARANGSCVGVNSFGFGGTNAHTVLARPPLLEAPMHSETALPPIVISAKSDASLRALSGRWHEALASTPKGAVASLARAAARRRDHHPHRLVTLTPDLPSTRQALGDFAAGMEPRGLLTGTALREAKLAFVYSGNGAQWSGMGKAAWETSAEFRAAIEELDAVLAEAVGWPLAERIRDGVDSASLSRADVAQPLLFAIQVGIVRALGGLGVTAAAHLGHSVGEIAAAWAAGALSLAAAGHVVIARSRSQQKTQGSGRMATLSLSEPAARKLIEELEHSIEIAAVNASRSVTLSGPEGELNRFLDEAQQRGIACRPLDLNFAFHSRAMEPIREELLASLAGLGSVRPESCLVSSVTGKRIESDRLDAGYWWDNIRRPVRFAEAVGGLIDEGCRIFLEIGPNPILQAYLRDGLQSAGAEGRVLGSLSREITEGNPFVDIAATLHIAGHDITPGPLFDGPAVVAGLPLYPWQRERFWFAETIESAGLVDPAFAHPLLGFRQKGPVDCWTNHLDTELAPWIADHRVDGTPLLPASATIEIILAAAHSRSPDAPAIEAADIELRRPLTFERESSRELRSLINADGDFELASRRRLAREPMAVHSVGRISLPKSGPMPVPAASGSVLREIGAAPLYRRFAALGIDYGPSFRTVNKVEIRGADEALVHLESGAGNLRERGYFVDPALLDGAFQALLALLAEPNSGLSGAVFLPWRFDRVRAFAPFGRVPRTAHLRVRRTTPLSVLSDFTLFDETGQPIVELAGCSFRRTEIIRRRVAEEHALRIDLMPCPLSDETLSAPELGDSLSRLCAETEPDRSRREQALLLEAAVAAAAREILCDLVPDPSRVAPGELAESGRIHPQSIGTAERLLRLVESFGAATTDGLGWRLEKEAGLPPLGEIWRLLLAEAPDLVAELALIANSLEELPRTLSRGPSDARVGLPPMLEQMIRASPAMAAGVDFARKALDQIARLRRKSRPLRILELGAAEGAADRFARTDEEYRIETCAALDSIEGDEFDVVLAVNSCAQLALDSAKLADLQTLLTPGGVFLAIEPEPNPLWDFSFEGAGGLQDFRPLRSGRKWCEMLADAGFADTGTVLVSEAPWPCAAIWATSPLGAPAPTSAREQPERFTIYGAGAFAEALGQAVAAAGHDVRVRQRDASVSEKVAETELGRDPPILVFIADALDAADASENIAREIASLAAIAAAATERKSPLWLVTCGAQQPGAPASREGILGAALWGFVRTLVNELPGSALRLLDLPAGLDPAARARLVAREFAATSPESEIVQLPNGRHVPRLRRGLPPRWAHAGAEIVLTKGHSGGIDALRWEMQQPEPPGPGEIAIEVRAAGLNFRDVMSGLGLLPEEALLGGFAGATLGLECAGIVAAVGAGVDWLLPGDRVMALAPAALSSRVVTRADAAIPVPSEMSFAAAATIPVAFVTAFYALGHLARLQEGECVLIHAAAGGVGLAAIQYAKSQGATVIATAGSPVKRSFLQLAGADYVLDSRDPGFADAVRGITRGEGVDVVLNSLSGEAMEESLRVLKPLGRFLELGKRDFYLDRRIRLRPMRQNVSYFAIDIDQLPVVRPRLARELLEQVAEALEQERIRPLAHRTFAFAEAVDAFRLMQASGHIGKLVLVPRGDLPVRLDRSPSKLSLRRDGTYIVTGGIDGFGYEAARWLAVQGAGAIALLGRRGDGTPGSEGRVAELAELGADARIYRADVADHASLSSVLERIRTTGPPLRGIIHAAAVIEDGLAAKLDATDFARVLRPKLDGALMLEAATREDPIDFFLLFSSATTLIGAPGQGAYVAANSALEALARQLRAEGRPATAIAWGPIADAGYLAQHPETRDRLARRLGARPMRTGAALSAIPATIASDLPTLAVADMDWAGRAQGLPILAAPFFSEIRIKAGSAVHSERLTERLASLSGAERLSLVKSVVAEETARILRLDAERIELQRPLSELGMDSLMAVELRFALEARLGIELPLMPLAEGPSIEAVAVRLAAASPEGSKTGEVAALFARHEVVEMQPSSEQAGIAQAAAEE